MRPHEAHGLAPADWSRLRSARLAALADSPQSFGAALADEEAWPAERWMQSLREARWAVVEESDGPIGLVVVRAATDVPDSDCWISSWWVAPSHRGAGVSDGLLDWLDRICRGQGWTRQGLGVWAENTRAQRAFARLGFVRHGGPRASTHFPGRRYVRMLRTVPTEAGSGL